MKVRVLETIAHVDPGRWNALLPPVPCPFLEHGYLTLLEQSGTLARWRFEPRHLTLWSGETLLAAAPCYLKHGEEGDQLPDWAARIALKNELPFYPTVFVGTPFTSVGGPKLLTAPEADRREAAERLIAAAKELSSASQTPVIHLYLSTSEEVELAGRAGFHGRISTRYAWTNEGYGSFEDFLKRFSSNWRSAFRRERRKVARAGIKVRNLRGAEVTSDTMELMYLCYKNTIEKYGVELDFFPREYFTLMAELVGHPLEIALAERGTEPLAGLFSAAAESALFPRGWGALEDTRFAIFEVFYHTIEEAISRGLEWVHAGGYADYKLQRGFVPAAYDHSATWVGEEELDEAVGALVQKERELVPRHFEEERRKSPLRSD